MKEKYLKYSMYIVYIQDLLTKSFSGPYRYASEPWSPIPGRGFGRAGKASVLKLQLDNTNHLGPSFYLAASTS